MIPLLCFLTGLGIVIYEVVFAIPASPTALWLGVILLGLPQLLDRVAPPRAKLEAKEYLTPLDKAWLGYHHYISGPDA